MAVDLNALLDDARPAERTVPVCLRGDLNASLQELQRALDEAERTRASSGASLAGGSPSRGIAEQIETLRAQMHSSTAVFTFRALPRRAWTALVAAHPPREGNDHDRAMGMNEETFFEALVRACLIDPVMDDAQWARLDDVLSDAQWQQLTNAAWAINARDVDVPFSSSASRVLATSDDE